MLGRWIVEIAYLLFSLIIRPMLVGTLIVGSAAAGMAILFALFWYLPPAWALAALLALALGLAVLLLLVIKDAAPPTEWP